MSDEWQPIETAPQNGKIILLKGGEAFTRDGCSVGTFISLFVRWLPWGDGMAWVTKQVLPYGNLEVRNPTHWQYHGQRGKLIDWEAKSN